MLPEFTVSSFFIFFSIYIFKLYFFKILLHFFLYKNTYLSRESLNLQKKIFCKYNSLATLTYQTLNTRYKLSVIMDRENEITYYGFTLFS